MQPTPIDLVELRNYLSGSRFPLYSARAIQFALAASEELNHPVALSAYHLFTEARSLPALANDWQPRHAMARALVRMWPRWRDRFREITEPVLD